MFVLYTFRKVTIKDRIIKHVKTKKRRRYGIKSISRQVRKLEKFNSIPVRVTKQVLGNDVIALFPSFFIPFYQIALKFDENKSLYNTMLNKMKKIYINDFLYSNEVIYKAFFGSADYDKELISKYCGYFRSLSSRDVDENYIISFHDNTQKGSIDVIGPYYNEAYKSYENMKDFYMRVIYVGETASVYSSIMNGNDVVLYITGGSTKKMLHDIGYRKYMTAPADSRASKKGNYLVVQMSDSFSYPDFIEQLENEL